MRRRAASLSGRGVGVAPPYCKRLKTGGFHDPSRIA